MWAELSRAYMEDCLALCLQGTSAMESFLHPKQLSAFHVQEHSLQVQILAILFHRVL